jgi:hypothetical protein
MKTLSTILIVAILGLGLFSGCKPHGSPAKSTGRSMGSAGIAEGVTAELLIQALHRNDFETIQDKTFEQIVPSSLSSSAYTGLVALRDTTIKEPNELVVAIGPDTVIWLKSHEISGNDAIADWEAHVQKRIALVEQLAANQQ